MIKIKSKQGIPIGEISDNGDVTLIKENIVTKKDEVNKEANNKSKDVVVEAK